MLGKKEFIWLPFVEVSVHNLLAPRQGSMAEGQQFMVVEKQQKQQEQKGEEHKRIRHNQLDTIFLSLILYVGYPWLHEALGGHPDTKHNSLFSTIEYA